MRTRVRVPPPWGGASGAGVLSPTPPLTLSRATRALPPLPLLLLRLASDVKREWAFASATGRTGPALSDHKPDHLTVEQSLA